MSKLADMITAVMALDPAAPALEFEGQWRTWGALKRDGDALAAALDAADLGPGARVGALLRNHAAFVSTLLSVFGAERCISTLNASAPDDKLAADIIKAAPPVIVALSADWARPALVAAAAEIGAIGLELTDDPEAPVRQLAALPGDRSRWTQAEAPGVAIEMLTSGTTGTPKRIPLQARNFEKALMSAAKYEKGRGEDDAPRLRSGVQIVTAPLAHIAGITGVMNNILAGRKVCLIDKFTVEAFRSAVARHRPPVAGAPPSALRMILDADVPKEDLSSLKAFRTGTAPLDPDLADAFYEKYGIPVLQNYGATEFAGGAAGWTLEDFKSSWKTKRGSVGRVNPGAEARTIDPETSEVLPAGELGLLQLRAPNIGDGKNWVGTNDLAIVDADNFLWIKGRHDNAIIRGGFKILPDDVIKALEAHPAIREASVVGLPDRRLGEIPVAAYIVRAQHQAPTEEELRTFLRERLMPYQVPVRLKAMPDMPRTPSMKVSLPALRALFESDGDV
jgi:acyl-CoA synthetase (AMP-forming)/AMP-acid ligase II